MTARKRARLQHWTENHPPHAGGWRWDDFPEMDEEQVEAPMEGAWLFGLALLAGLVIGTLVLVAVGVMT